MIEQRKYYEECKIGDVIARDVVDSKRGVVLCARGHILTQESLTWLSRFQVGEVYIQKDDWGKVWNINEQQIAQYKEDIEKVKNMLNATEKNKIIQKEMMEELEKDFFGRLNEHSTIIGCVNMIKDVASYTYAHSLNVAMLAVLLGKWMKLSVDEQKELFYAGLLHDIGKCRIPDSILNKRTKVTDQELRILKAHVDIGYDIVQNSLWMSDVIKRAVVEHHERCDGTGYPRQLRGSAMHLYGKILGVVDVYDAMISEKVYKKKNTPFKVMEYLMIQEMGRLDPEILLTFLKNLANYYVGVEVKLSNHMQGEVVFVPSQCVYRPIVKVGEQLIDLSIKKDLKIVDMI